MPDELIDAVLSQSRSFGHWTVQDRSELGGLLGLRRFANGARLTEQGSSERSLFIICSGEVQIIRGDTILGTVGSGDHVGELELISGVPRIAALVATTDTSVAELTPAGYEQLRGTRLGSLLLEALLETTARRLASNPAMGTSLSQSPLPRARRVSVRQNGSVREVQVGTPLSALLPKLQNRLPVVAALMDRRAVSLTTRVTTACHLEALTTAHWEGQRVYRHSLGMLAIEAGQRVAPALTLRMGHSIGFAQRVLVPEVAGSMLDDLARRLEQMMVDLTAAGLPLNEQIWTIEDARRHFAQVGWLDALALLDTWREPMVPIAGYGEVLGLSLGPLLPDTSALTGFRVLRDEQDLVILYGARAASRPLASRMMPSVPPSATLGTGSAPPVSQAPADEVAFLARQALRTSRQIDEMTGMQRRWLDALGVNSVGVFNDACVSGEVSRLIRVSEGCQEKCIGVIADRIRERAHEARVVCIAGPSSSGKSTFIKRLSIQLQVTGLQPVGLGLDDYYVDRDLTPRDRDGQYDFEAFEAIDAALLGGHLRALLAGDTVTTPRYDFVAGKSYREGGTELAVGPENILLVEGLHCLNPRLLETIPERNVFRIFICPLIQLPVDRVTRIHASDVRLLRRIVRDRHSRNLSPSENILRWPAVRSGERMHIFPYQHHADAVFDSSLIYELSVLKVFAERYLLEVPRDHAAYTTAHRLSQLLRHFVAIYPDHVPPTSILREFIGASGFEY